MNTNSREEKQLGSVGMPVEREDGFFAEDYLELRSEQVGLEAAFLSASIAPDR